MSAPANPHPFVGGPFYGCDRCTQLRDHPNHDLDPEKL